MPFQWNLCNNPIDTVALERMKQHFPKPAEPMPEAWFMGTEINYYTWLAEMAPEVLDAKSLAGAMNEIAGGIVAFPKIVEVWQPWFRYLLPYALARAAERSTNWKSVLVETLTAFLSVYPQEIREEYLGFRDDVVYSLGTRVYPDKLSPDRLLMR